MKIKRGPQKATRCANAHELIEQAWFYENAKSIDVYISRARGENAVVCRISRAKLLDWIKRTEQE